MSQLEHSLKAIINAELKEYPLDQPLTRSDLEKVLVKILDKTLSEYSRLTNR